MTEERQDIKEDFYSGNSKKIRVSVTDPNGAKLLTGATITFAVFVDKTGVVILRKSSVNIDEITIDDALGGILTIHLLPKDTFNVHGSFRYHVNVVDADGYEETVTVGRLDIFESFAKRPVDAHLSVYLSA
jgi:hypothetical protein